MKSSEIHQVLVVAWYCKDPMVLRYQEEVGVGRDSICISMSSITTIMEQGGDRLANRWM